MGMQHLLKTWPPYYQDIIDGRKTFEFRKNDRDFLKGDTLCLQEWNPGTQKYTGRQTERKVLYITRDGQFGIPKDYCVMGFCTPNTQQAQAEICSDIPCDYCEHQGKLSESDSICIQCCEKHPSSNFEGRKLRVA